MLYNTRRQCYEFHFKKITVLLEFSIKTYNPEEHIQICELISLSLTHILSDKIGSESEDFYGMFLLRGGSEIYDIFSEFKGINLEIQEGKVTR